MEWALNEGATLDVRGQGSKLALGRPMECRQVLDLSGIAGVVDYAPEELVVTLRAGTPLSEVEALLAQRNQMLAFEPPDLGPLLGLEAGQGTLVGAVMGNLAGSRRVSAGAARDHLLGFSGVNGRGETFKSGGKVMKNVTGYDLSKLLAGSWGTLAVLDEVSVKVLPAPDQTRTLLLLGLPDEAAVKAMCAAMGSRTMSRVRPMSATERPCASKAWRRRSRRGSRACANCWSWRAQMEELGTLESRTFWREVRDVAPLKAAARCHRVEDLLPSDRRPRHRRPHQGAAALLSRRFYDWSGGLIWSPCRKRRCRPRDRARRVGSRRRSCGLDPRPGGVRAGVPVLQPQPAAPPHGPGA